MPRHLTKKTAARRTGIDTNCGKPGRVSLSSKWRVSDLLTVDWKIAIEDPSTCDLKITMGYLFQG